MLKVIGLIVFWPILMTILTTVFNAARVKLGKDVDDWVSQFLIGYVWGPIGVLLGLNPFNLHRLIGGFVGTYGAYKMYHLL